MSLGERHSERAFATASGWIQRWRERVANRGAAWARSARMEKMQTWRRGIAEGSSRANQKDRGNGQKKQSSPPEPSTRFRL
jgi:hypothetical protein